MSLWTLGTVFTWAAITGALIITAAKWALIAALAAHGLHGLIHAAIRLNARRRT